MSLWSKLQASGVTEKFLRKYYLEENLSVKALEKLILDSYNHELKGNQLRQILSSLIIKKSDSNAARLKNKNSFGVDTMLSQKEIRTIQQEQLRYANPENATWRKRRATEREKDTFKSISESLIPNKDKWSNLNKVNSKIISHQSHILVFIECLVCGLTYAIAPYNKVSGKSCSACASRKRLSSYRKTIVLNSGSIADKAPKWILKQWHQEKNTLKPDEVSYGTALDAWWLCDLCGNEWRSSVKNRLSQLTPCQNCKPKSLIENDFLEILRKVFHGQIEQNKQPLRGENKTRYQLDFWLPELKLAFEIQDYATHSKNRDDEPGFYRKELIKKGPTYHELKRRLAKEQLGVTLIDIWEDELKEENFTERLEVYILNSEQS